MSACNFLDFKIDLNAGGDALLHYSSLEIPEYDINQNHLAWVWFRPAIRVNLGAFSQENWIRRLSAEFSAVIALGNSLFIDERMRLEASLLWRVDSRKNNSGIYT